MWLIIMKLFSPSPWWLEGRLNIRHDRRPESLGEPQRRLAVADRVVGAARQQPRQLGLDDPGHVVRLLAGELGGRLVVQHRLGVPLGRDPAFGQVQVGLAVGGFEFDAPQRVLLRLLHAAELEVSPAARAVQRRVGRGY